MTDSKISIRVKPDFITQKQARPTAHTTQPAGSFITRSVSHNTEKDQVRFSGRTPQDQPPSLKTILKMMLFVSSVVTAGMQATGMGKPNGPKLSDNKGVTLPGFHNQPQFTPTAPSIFNPASPQQPDDPKKPQLHTPEPTQHAKGPQGPNGPQDPDDPNDPTGYKHGDMLDSPMEAVYLAKTGQVAHAPDALKVITGPGNEKLLYEIKLKNGATVGLSVPHDAMENDNFLRELKGEHIKPKAVPPEESTLWNLTNRVMQEVVPLIVVMGIVKMMRGMGNAMSGSNLPPGLGGSSSTRNVSKDKKQTADEKPVTFADVRGYPEVIRELKRVKERYLLGNLHRGDSKIKVKPIKGLLLEGPPGTGKSMMAKALAHEANVPFFYASGSQFVEMYVGVGAARVRQLFASAKAAADKTGGAIIFIDELDAVGGKRNEDSHRGGNSEHTQTLNELLQQMSGFNDDPRIMVLAATNRKDHLDDALQRSGRFDKSIKVDLPHDPEQRKDILDKYLAEHPTAKKLDRDVMAEFTAGKSGADLANLVNQMAEVAVDRISEAQHNPAKKHLLNDPEFHKLQTKDFMDAVRNMEMGIKRESRGTHDERKTVAVHEVLGHGLVARAAKTPLHIVSMQPRGDALGHVITDPRVNSKKLPTLEGMLKDLVISMGGRASEREMLGAEKITPGASGDIAQSKAKIRQMLATRMLNQASGADIDGYSALNEHDRKLADSLLKNAERTAEEVIRSVPREKLWKLVENAMNLEDELEGDDANAFYEDLIDTVGADKLYEPIHRFIQNTVEPKTAEPKPPRKNQPKP